MNLNDLRLQISQDDTALDSSFYPALPLTSQVQSAVLCQDVLSCSV
jgi:hypothetical protein